MPMRLPQRRRQQPPRIRSEIVVALVVAVVSVAVVKALHPSSPHRSLRQQQQQGSKTKRLSSLISPPSSSSSSSSLIDQKQKGKRHNRSNNGDDRRRLQNLAGQSKQHPLLTLNLNLDSLASLGAASRAQELLHRIDALYAEGYYEVSPDVVSYNSVLKAWKEDDNPAKALELLEGMTEGEQVPSKAFSSSSSSVLPKLPKTAFDVISFNTVLAAFAQQGEYTKTLALLQKMKEADNHYPRPDTISYNSVLYALAQSPGTGTAAQAEKILRDLIDDEHVSPDTFSYNTVMYAWLRIAGTRDGGDHEMSAAARADNLLTMMEDLADAGSSHVVPDQYSYTTVMQAYAKSEQPKQARAVLDRMVRRGLKPNRHACTALMSAWAKAGKVEEAQAMLQQMMDDYQATGYVEHKPDTVTFSSVIDGWARVSEVKRPEAAMNALDLLWQMKEWAGSRYGDDAFRPNARTYTSVMAALAKSGTWEACEHVEQILDEMEEDYLNQAPGDQDSAILRPTNIHYNSLLNAIARSPRPNKAEMAQRVLDEMILHPRSDCRPDTISYNTVLMACANASGKDHGSKIRSFQIAMNAFRTLVNKKKNGEDDGCTTSGELAYPAIRSLQPTSSTFNHFLKLARLSLPAEEVKSVLTKTLRLCRELGLVNHLVIHQVQLACKSQSEWNDVAEELADYVVWKANFKHSCRDVPKKWTKNARR